MSILKMLGFTGNAAATPAQAAAPIPAPVPAGGNVPPGNSGVPDGTPAKVESPFDQFNKLWDNVPATGTALTPSEPLFNIDNAGWQDIASKANLVGAIPQEVYAAIHAGGEQGLKAFETAQRTLASNVFAQSLAASAKLIETALQKNNSAVESKLPTFLKQQQVESSVITSNPSLKHEAANFVVTTLASRLTAQNPTASATEIAEKIGNYLKALGSSIPGAAPNQKNVPQVVDWSKYAKG